MVGRSTSPLDGGAVGTCAAGSPDVAPSDGGAAGAVAAGSVAAGSVAAGSVAGDSEAAGSSGAAVSSAAGASAGAGSWPVAGASAVVAGCSATAVPPAVALVGPRERGREQRHEQGGEQRAEPGETGGRTEMGHARLKRVTLRRLTRLSRAPHDRRGSSRSHAFPHVNFPLFAGFLRDTSLTPRSASDPAGEQLLGVAAGARVARARPRASGTSSSTRASSDTGSIRVVARPSSSRPLTRR